MFTLKNLARKGLTHTEPKQNGHYFTDHILKCIYMKYPVMYKLLQLNSRLGNCRLNLGVPDPQMNSRKNTWIVVPESTTRMYDIPYCMLLHWDIYVCIYIYIYIYPVALER